MVRASSVQTHGCDDLAPLPYARHPCEGDYLLFSVRGARMGADQAVELMRQLLWSSVVIAAPVLIAALAVGLLISVFQVATQLQEMTLSYIPKLGVAAVMLLILGPWMITQITQFAVRMIKLIPAMG